MEKATIDKVHERKLQKLPIIDPVNPNRKFSEKEEKHLREVVNYEFMNLEEPGLGQKFSYGNASNKHTFEFEHGGKYLVPRFIARHVESRSTPIWGWQPDGTGSMQKTLKGRNSRFQMREVFE
jgi:hypothetical protein